MAKFAEAEAVSTENQDSSPQKTRTTEYLKSKLTKEEFDRLNKKQVTIEELAAERRRLKDEAESELNRLVTSDRNHESLITTKECRDLRSQLNGTESPAQTRKILEKIKELERQKEQEKGNAAENGKRLDPEDPKLLELQEKFDKICDENEHLIGKKQVAGFKEWFAQERKRNPTVGHLNEQIRRLEGKEVTDRNGLAPRREEYQILQKLFKRHNLGEPTDSKYIEREGLSERKQFRQNAETMEKHLSQQKDTGFYSKEMIEATMEEVLTADNPSKQADMINKAKNIARKESESFTYLDSKMDVKGKNIRKMSQASKKEYMGYYKDTGFKERESLVNKWRELVENEAKLAGKLQEIYGEDVKGLHLALEKFETLDWFGKQEALKEHEQLVKEKTDKNERHKELLLDAAQNAIDGAAKENTISEKTAERYHKLFEDENNYKNPETHKPGDLKTLQKMYDILTSPTPQANYKNLAAYKSRRDNFTAELAVLQKVDPKLEDEEITEWQEKYDQEGWSKRALIHEQLKKEVLKKKLEASKNREKEKAAGLTEKEKKEGKEFTKEKSEVIEAATIHMSEDNPREALKLLLLFDEQTPNDKQILFLIEMAAKQLRELGSKNEVDNSFDKELEEELKQTAGRDQNRKDLEEEQVTNLNIVGAKQSEQRHDKQKEAGIRAEDESFERLPANSIEEDLIEDYYENNPEEGYILNEEGTGEEVEEVVFDDIAWTDQERHTAKVHLFKKQDRITHKEGLLNQFKDKSGRIITSEEAGRKQEKDLDALSDTLAEESYDKVEKKQVGKAPIGNIIEMQRRVAAKRKARQYVDKRINERIKDAA